MSVPVQEQQERRTAADIRIAMLRNGYLPIPCNGKFPAGTEWQKRTETNEAEILLWDKVFPYDQNTGFLCHKTPVLDVDIADTEACSAVFKRVRYLLDGNGRVLCRIGNLPKFAVPFRTDEPFKKMKVALTSPDGVEMKLELLCDGQQCLAFGRHPSGVDYRWWPDVPIVDPTTVPRADLPYINEERARELLEDLADLLVRDLGYIRAGAKAAKNGHDPHGNAEDKSQAELVANIIAGRELHDSILSLAGKFVTSGMGGGAVVNQLRALMDQSAARKVRPDDWQARYDDIPRTVDYVQETSDQPESDNTGNQGADDGTSENPKSDTGTGVQGTEGLQQNPPEPNDGPDPNASAKINEAAFFGLAGHIVKTIEPHTEADPIAILIQVLTYFGSVIGGTAYYLAESDRHHANLFGVLVGASSKSRKGTSSGRVRAVLENVDDQWSRDRIKGGLSSGEGLINEVRDAVEKWDAKEQTTVTVDPGVRDKRLLVIEPEFANVLSVMERAGNTLSPVIRNAWDGKTLQTLTKTSPIKATNPHISIVGHITEDELRARMTRTDAANGFGNRFLFICVGRSKLLPFGGHLDQAEITRLGERMREAVEFAQRAGRIQMTSAAREIWAAIYAELSAGQAGLLGAITARAEAQTVRLAMIYALLDKRDEIDAPHLQAAIALWEYAEASAVRIFGDSLGDPVADDILRALRQAGTAGMTRTAIHDLFGRHRGGERIGVALGMLATKGLVRIERRSTAGRPVEVWFPVEKKRRV